MRALCVLLLLSVAPAVAATGVCDSNPPTTTEACINAIQASGGVVNDIFRDKNGRTATQLPAYGTLVSAFAGCGTVNMATCNGVSNSPYDCPGQYTCALTDNSLAAVRTLVGAVDHTWGHPCRLTDHALVGGCPNWASCVTDGVGGNYNPWEGLVFDLGGPSNQVAIFAENDHGPQPCESAEYTVFLTNDPNAREVVLQPAVTGADPGKWNRAVLKKIFTKGFVEVRAADPTGHASCGDTANYSVEEDSMVTVYGLPCSINFRYAAVVAGNDGRDFPACAFDSSEAELDAVAGLTEDGAGVCPDHDGDGYVDCKCPGAPAVCDCDDANPAVHPNAAEACDSASDLNCDGKAGLSCQAGFGCYGALCLRLCADDEFHTCPDRSSCGSNDAGTLVCLPDSCASGCPSGTTCDPGTQRCRGVCDSSVVCPVGQRCQDGQCVDACRGVSCGAGASCVNGACVTPCSCFQGDVGCASGLACDRGAGGTNQCVATSCVGVGCTGGKHCVGGTCVGVCTGVKCPGAQVCLEPDGGSPGGCIDLCASAVCGLGTQCDPATGRCIASGAGGGSGGGHAGGGAGGASGAGGGAGHTDGGTDGGVGTGLKGTAACGCQPVDGGVAALALLALALLGRRRES